MRSALAVLGLALFATLATCTCDERRGAPEHSTASGAPTDPAYPHATIRRVCAAGSERGLLLVLGASGNGCAPVAARRVTLFVGGADVAAPARLTLGGPGSDGSGRLCPEGGAPCRLARTGTLALEALEPDRSARGRWSLEVEGVGSVSGVFDAAWCPDEPCP